MVQYTLVNNENPIQHWQYINVNNKIVLDLGCGRWEQIEHRDPQWLTTPEYFLSNNAKKVIAVDTNPEEISWFKSKFKDIANIEFILQSIDSKEDIINLYDKYQPNCVKCDIEGNEQCLLELSEEKFCSIDEYYIETHGNNLYIKIIEILNKYKYTITNQIDLTHTRDYCKVIFAKKI